MVVAAWHQMHINNAAQATLLLLATAQHCPQLPCCFPRLQPSFDPGVESTPFMTWGDIEGTPLRIEAEDLPPGPLMEGGLMAALLCCCGRGLYAAQLLRRLVAGGSETTAR